MEIIILCLPIKYEKLINYLYETNNDNIEDLVTLDTSVNKVYKMSGSEIDIVQENNNDKNLVYNEIKGKNVITSTLINIKYDCTNIENSRAENINVDNIKFYKTDIYCWWCCHGFNSYPVSVPIKLYPQNYLFKCKGIFCGFSCALAYCINKGHDVYLLKLLHKKILNLKFSDIKPIKKAPIKEILQRFGGPITIDEFRSSSTLLNDYNIITYPITFMNEQLHLETIDSVNNKIKFHDIVDDSLLSQKTIKQAKNRLQSANKEAKVKNSITNKLTNINN